MGPRRAGIRAIVGRWRLTAPRAAAILGLLASAGAIYGLAATPAFTLARTELPELRWTTHDALTRAVATPDGSSLFRIRAGPIEDRLRSLPGIADARVTVSLPDTIAVTIEEREAILIWAIGDVRLLVDREGVLFADAPPASVATAGLPRIVDTRPESVLLAIGAALDPIDLDAATRLGSLVPADIRSSAAGLLVTITEASGFVVRTIPRTWTAVFGLYTPNLRTPAIIPGQVRLLRSLLTGREDIIDRVILADEDSGTFIPKATTAP